MSLRAERKGGEVSRQLDKAKGGRPTDETRAAVPRVLTKTEQLNAAGVSRRQAQEWERLAAVPEEQFERDLAKIIDPDEVARGELAELYRGRRYEDDAAAALAAGETRRVSGADRPQASRAPAGLR